MLILRTYTFLADLMDLGALHRNDCQIGFRAPFISLKLTIWSIISIFSIVSDLGNLSDLGSAAIMLHGHMTVMAIYWKFLFHYDRFILLLDDLQGIVNDSMYDLCDSMYLHICISR